MAKPKKPARIDDWLGSGLLQKAAELMKGRKQSVDATVDEAVTGKKKKKKQEM